MTTLRFYQGLATIGGTIVDIQTEAARCLFDFGLVYDPRIDARVLPRPDACVHDGLMTGSLAPIEGVYGQEALRGLPLKAYGQTQPEPFVLISHMHIDHMGALPTLAEDVEVFLSEDSLRLYRGLRNSGDLPSGYHRNTVGLRPMRWRQKGDMRFRAIPVDHDVPGACGFEIETPDGRICYTGDLRLHGRYGDKSLVFADAVQHADVCIAEGTTVSFIEDFDAVEPTGSLEGVRTEALVEQEIVEAAQANGGMVFLNLYRRNVERVNTLHRALKSAGRQLVMQCETAVLYRQFYPDEPVAVFAPSPGKRKLPHAEAVSGDMLRAHPARYALDLPYERLLETLDFDPAASLYIHSDGVPLG
ncbi:MAG: MBL fold metallo-hydrolase, partial [Firmicutes bacterium]|nr:MBL fold metallo-hydrolase [Bacillota bacterium]